MIFHFHLLKHPYNTNVFNTHDVLYDIFHYLKNNLSRKDIRGLSNIPQCPSYASQWSLVYLFSTLKPTTSPMYFWTSSNIISNAFNFQFFDAFYGLEKKIFMFNLTPSVFPMCLLDTLIICCCHFDILCQHSYLFVFLHFSTSMVLFRCIFFVDKT